MCSHASVVVRPRCSTATASRWLTVHQLRHTRGTQMVQDGHALHIVQRALGHTDPRSTQLYADVTEDDVHRALETRR